jgi:hypothetical protein
MFNHERNIQGRVNNVHMFTLPRVTDLEDERLGAHRAEHAAALHRTVHSDQW